MEATEPKSSDEFPEGDADDNESSNNREETTITEQEAVLESSDEIEEQEDPINEEMDSSSSSPHNTTSLKEENSPLSSPLSDSLEVLDSPSDSPSSSSSQLKTSDHSPQSEKTKLPRPIRKPTRFQDGAVDLSPTDVVKFFEVEDLEAEKTTIKLVKVKSPDDSIASTSEEPKPTTAIIHSDETRDKCVSFDENGNFRFKVCKEHTLRKNGGLTSYRCDICDMLFPRSFSLRRHYERIHINPRFVRNKGKKDQDILSKLLEADKAAGSSSLKHQKERKENETFFLYACKMCSKQQSFFKTKKELRHHHQSKHCAMIQKQFAAFKCESCDRSYATRHELRRHKRSHSGERPYACQYCNKRFPTSTNARRHERTHTGDRPHVCKVCNKRFIQKTDMAKHLRAVHKMKVTKTKAQIAGKKDTAEETTPDNKSNQFEENIDFAAYLNLDQYEKGTLMGGSGSNEAELMAGSSKLLGASPDSPKQTESTETRAKSSQPDPDADGKNLVTMNNNEGSVRCHPCPDCSKLFTSKVNMRRHYRLKHERNQVVRSALPVSMVVSKFKIQDETQTTNKLEEENFAPDHAGSENGERNESNVTSVSTLPESSTSIASSPTVPLTSSFLLEKSNDPTSTPPASISCLIQPLIDPPVEIKKGSPSTSTNKQGSKLGKILERLSNRKTASNVAETAEEVTTKPTSLNSSEETKVQRRSENIISSDTLLQSMQPRKKKNLAIRNNPFEVAKYIKQRYSHPANSLEEKQHKFRHSLMMSKKIKKPAEAEADRKQQEKKPVQFLKAEIERSDRKFHPYQKASFQSKYRSASENVRFFPNAARPPINQSRFHPHPSRFHSNLLRHHRKHPRPAMYPHVIEQSEKEFYRPHTLRGVVRQNTKQEQKLFPQRSRHSYPVSCKHEHSKMKSFLDDCWRSKMNEHSECKKCLQKSAMQNPMWNVSTTPRPKPLLSHPPNELWRTSKHIARDHSINNTCVSSTNISSSSSTDTPLDLRHPSKKPASDFVITKSGVLDLSRKNGKDLSDQKLQEIKMKPEATFPQNLSRRPHEIDYDVNKAEFLERHAGVTSAHPTLKFHNVMFDKGRQVHGAGTAGRPIKLPSSAAPLYREPPQPMKHGVSRDRRQSFDQPFPPDHVMNRFNAHKFTPIRSRYGDIKSERHMFSPTISNMHSADGLVNTESSYALPFVPHSQTALLESNKYRLSSRGRHRTFSREDASIMRSRLTHHHDNRESEDRRRNSGDVDDVMTRCIQKAQNELMRNSDVSGSPLQNMESRLLTHHHDNRESEKGRRNSGDVADVMATCIQKAQNELMRNSDVSGLPLQNIESLRSETLAQNSSPPSHPSVGLIVGIHGASRDRSERSRALPIDGLKPVPDPSFSRISLTMTPGFDTNGEDSSRDEDVRSPAVMVMGEEIHQMNIEKMPGIYFDPSRALQESPRTTIHEKIKSEMLDEKPPKLTTSGRPAEDEQPTSPLLNCDVEHAPTQPSDVVTTPHELVKETDLSIADLKETNLSHNLSCADSSNQSYDDLVKMESIPSEANDFNQSNTLQQSVSEHDQLVNMTSYVESHLNESKSERKYIQKIKLRAVKSQENNGTKKWTLVDAPTPYVPGTSPDDSNNSSPYDLKEFPHEPDGFVRDSERSHPEETFDSYESFISSRSDVSAPSSELVSSSHDSCDIPEKDDVEIPKTESMELEALVVSTNEISTNVSEGLESTSTLITSATVEPEESHFPEHVEDESTQQFQSYEGSKLITSSIINDPIIFTLTEDPVVQELIDTKQKTTPIEACEEPSTTNVKSPNEMISVQSVQLFPQVHDETKHETASMTKHELSSDIVVGSCIEILELQQPSNHTEATMVTSSLSESMSSETEFDPVTTIPSMLDHGYAVMSSNDSSKETTHNSNGDSCVTEMPLYEVDNIVSLNPVLVPITTTTYNTSITVTASEVASSRSDNTSPLAGNVPAIASCGTASVFMSSCNITSSPGPSSNVTLKSPLNVADPESAADALSNDLSAATSPCCSATAEVVSTSPITSSIAVSSNCTSSTMTSSSDLRLDMNEATASSCDDDITPVTSSNDIVSSSVSTRVATSTSMMSFNEHEGSANASSLDSELSDNAVVHDNEVMDSAPENDEALDITPRKLVTSSNATLTPSTVISLRARKTAATSSTETKAKSTSGTRKAKSKPLASSAKIRLNSPTQTTKGSNDVTTAKPMRTRSSMGDDITKRSKKRSCVKQDVEAPRKKLKKKSQKHVKITKTSPVTSGKPPEIDHFVVKNPTRGMRPSKILPQTQSRPKRGDNPPKSKPPPLTRRSIRKYSKKVSTVKK